MMNSHYISTLIIKGETEKIKTVMGEMDNESHTFDKVLCDLVGQNTITREEALKTADSRINLSLMLQSGDDNLYPQNEYVQEEISPEDNARKQRLIDMTRERKNKKTRQK